MTSTRPTRDEIIDALRSVEDPEAPISIVDLGLVETVSFGGDGVTIRLLPTYTSCPARSLIQRRVENRIQTALPGIDVNVEWALVGGWTTARLSQEGREALRDFGIAVVQDEGEVWCPNCNSTAVDRDSQFGCAVCKSLYYCRDCRNPFEVLRGSLVLDAPTAPTARRLELVSKLQGAKDGE